MGLKRKHWHRRTVQLVWIMPCQWKKQYIGILNFDLLDPHPPPSPQLHPIARKKVGSYGWKQTLKIWMLSDVWLIGYRHCDKYKMSMWPQPRDLTGDGGLHGMGQILCQWPTDQAMHHLDLTRALGHMLYCKISMFVTLTPRLCEPDTKITEGGGNWGGTI